MPQRTARSTAWFALALGALMLSPLPVRAADLQADAQRLIEAAKLGPDQCSILAVNLSTGEQLFSDGAETPVAPASNMKLLTTSAAMKILGPDFQFHTSLRLVRPKDWTPAPGVPTPVAAGDSSTPCSGNVLIVQGDGDPSFGDSKMPPEMGSDSETILKNWVSAVKAAGVTKIDKIIVDDRIFDREMVNPNWPEEQLLHWYCAQVTGIAFNDNCLDVYPQANGSYRTEPDASFLHINNKLLKGHNQPVNLNRKLGGNDFTFTGGVSQNTTEAMTVTLHDPAGFFGQVLAHRLIAEGISVGSISRPEYAEQLPKGTTLITYTSTLPQVIHRCNRDSQNLFAESLIKRIGAKVTGQPGSWENGSAAINQLFQQKLSSNAAGVEIVDGSGMSKENRVTARAIVGVLHMMASDPKTAEPFRASLAIAGIDGTLKKRFKDQLRGRFFGKTGFINGVSSLSGYILVDSPKGNQLIAISMVFNGFRGADFGTVRHLQEQLIEMTYDRLGG